VNSTVATGEPLKAPFPYPGGKSRVADLVWQRLGNVDNFVEPFAGTLAVLLRRPAEHLANGYRVETVNDANHYLVNFWRSVKYAPADVAEWADWPVMEADLHARHKWLVRSREAAEWREAMRTDPEHFNAKIAGWWVWGQCCWIGGQWCQDGVSHKKQMPQIDQQNGLHRNTGITDWEQVPKMGSGDGIISVETRGRPQLTDAFDIGRGVNAGGTLWTKRPNMDPGDHGILAAKMVGTCSARREWLTAWMGRLSDRLRLVRTCYGDWSRICSSDSTLTRLGTTGVFLDPPYPANRGDNGKKSRDNKLYATDSGADLDKLRDDVLAWCRKWEGPQVRIAVCGYEGDGYEALGWETHEWETGGGYANQRRGGKGKSENAKRERIWFSPACIKDDGPKMADLF
jgi:DNA adenine methylase